MEPGEDSFARCDRMGQEIAVLVGDMVNEFLGKTVGTTSCYSSKAGHCFARYENEVHKI
jgi:hypothetical protein